MLRVEHPDASPKSVVELLQMFDHPTSKFGPAAFVLRIDLIEKIDDTTCRAMWKLLPVKREPQLLFDLLAILHK